MSTYDTEFVWLLHIKGVFECLTIEWPTNQEIKLSYCILLMIDRETTTAMRQRQLLRCIHTKKPALINNGLKDVY